MKRFSLDINNKQTKEIDVIDTDQAIENIINEFMPADGNVAIVRNENFDKYEIYIFDKDINELFRILFSKIEDKVLERN